MIVLGVEPRVHLTPRRSRWGPVGALEPKKVGVTPASVEAQVRMYCEGQPASPDAPIRPLPFQYMSNGGRDPHGQPRPLHRSRRIIATHRPETLAEWLQATPYAGRQAKVGSRPKTSDPVLLVVDEGPRPSSRRTRLLSPTVPLSISQPHS